MSALALASEHLPSRFIGLLLVLWQHALWRIACRLGIKYHALALALVLIFDNVVPVSYNVSNVVIVRSLDLTVNDVVPARDPALVTSVSHATDFDTLAQTFLGSEVYIAPIL